MMNNNNSLRPMLMEARGKLWSMWLATVVLAQSMFVSLKYSYRDITLSKYYKYYTER